MSTTKSVNLSELTELSQMGNTDVSPEIQPRSSTILCSIAVSVLTSPTISLTVTAAANCWGSKK